MTAVAHHQTAATSAVNGWNGSIFSSQRPEEAMIGGLLIWPHEIATVSDELELSDMVTPLGQRVYGAMLALWDRGILPEERLLINELIARGDLDAVGGEQGVYDLHHDAPTIRPVRYVQAILESSLRHKVRLAGRDIELLAKDGAVPVGEVYEQAKDMLQTLERPTAGELEGQDVATFCEGEDRYDWLIKGLMERGERLLVVAGEGEGKSLLLRQISTCASFGIHPFSSLPISPIKVLLLDLENPDALVRRKVRPMLAQARRLRPQGDPLLLTVICKPGGIDVTNRTDARWLTTQLTGHRPDLLVAGPLYKMFQADDKWEQGARAVTAILDDLRTRLGFALILETHAPQAFGGQRHLRPIGSSLWLRWPEFGMSFAPLDAYPNIVKVTAWKKRDERSWPTHLQRGGVWPWTPCADPSNPSGPTHTPGAPPPRYEQDDF